MMHQLSQNAIDTYKPDLLIKIPSKTCGIFDFYKSKELIEIGRDKAIEQLNLYEDKIKKAP